MLKGSAVVCGSVRGFMHHNDGGGDKMARVDCYHDAHNLWEDPIALSGAVGVYSHLACIEASRSGFRQ